MIVAVEFVSWLMKVRNKRCVVCVSLHENSEVIDQWSLNKSGKRKKRRKKFDAAARYDIIPFTNIHSTYVKYCLQRGWSSFCFNSCSCTSACVIESSLCFTECIVFFVFFSITSQSHRGKPKLFCETFHGDGSA